MESAFQADRAEKGRAHDKVQVWAFLLQVAIRRSMIEILFWLFTKHFFFDFLLQTQYQFLNKGKYGHFGGILHSGLQGLGTFIILGPIAALIDFVVHYHVDWAKVQINSRYGWKADTSEKFWWLLGFDQYLHTLTYLGLAMWYQI